MKMLESDHIAHVAELNCTSTENREKKINADLTIVAWFLSVVVSVLGVVHSDMEKYLIYMFPFLNYFSC